MPRLTGIPFRRVMGLIPKSKMTKKQRQIAETLKPDLVEYYFGRRCEYWKLDRLKL